MIVMEFRFTAGRYHATPWCRHVNEGAVEWPPSPWRILRALVAMWHSRMSDVPRNQVSALVEALAAPPSYVLPPVSFGHSRHYMPTEKHDKKTLQIKTTLVFDSFVTLDPQEPLYVLWSGADLSEAQRVLLARLLENLAYLGRAESWVQARLVEDAVSIPPNALPRVPGRVDSPDLDPGAESVRLLLPSSPVSYLEWLAAEKARRQARAGEEPAAKSRKRRGKKGRAGKETLPEDLLGCLEMDSVSLRKGGWNLPPGARWQEYRVMSNRALWTDRGIDTKRREGSRPTLALFGLACDTEGADVRPLVTKGLGLAETIRQALMAHSRDSQGLPSPLFSGKDPSGRPLAGHRHAFILPSDEDGDGRIDTLLLFSREGFGDRERKALVGLRKLWQSKGAADLFPLLTGLGQPEDYARTGDLSLWQPGRSRLLSRARHWASVTPYVPTRHPKKNGKDSPMEQLRRDLGRMGFPEPELVEPLDALTVSESRRRIRWLEFTTTRRGGGGARGMRFGTGFRIRFAEPVAGPIAVGFGAHFGLGLFAPDVGEGSFGEAARTRGV